MICTYSPFTQTRSRFTTYGEVPIGVKFYGYFTKESREERWFRKRIGYLERVDFNGSIYNFGNLNSFHSFLVVEMIP